MTRNNAYSPDGWVFKNNWLIGTEWTVSGSKGNSYTVRITERGFVCDCTGFVFYGKCKHSKGVADKFDEYG